MAEAPPPPPPGMEAQQPMSPPEPGHVLSDGVMNPENPAQPEAHEMQPGDQAQPGEQAPPPGGEQPQHSREELLPDGKHSWMVAGAAAWNVFCCSLLRRAMPVMFLAVDEAFATTSKGAVAWMNAFIYSLAYMLSPVVTVQCRTMPLNLLSIGGALLIGVGQMLCFVLGSLVVMVPVIGLCCGVGAALSTVVDETAVYLHFKAERRKALSFCHVAFSVSAIVYPVVFGLLVSVYGLDGAMLVSGAISLNALAGSMLMSRPPWMSPSDPVPSIHRPEGADVHPDAEEQGATKVDVTEKPEASKMSVAQTEDHSTAVNPGVVSGAASGATSVDPGTAVASAADATAANSAAHAEGAEHPPPEGQGDHPQHDQHEAEGAKSASPPGGVEKPGLDGSVGGVLAAHCALTSLSVTAGVVIYDYAMGGDPARSSSATLALLSYAAGDLVGRMFYESLLSTGEYRKVMALQAFLQGGVLFLMAVASEVFLLAPIVFGLGGISSTLDLLPVPVLQRFMEPDAVERQLGICRAASGIGCLIGPVLVMVFLDGMGSYAIVFIVSGLLSIIAGALWLPGLKKEMEEAHGKTAAAAAPEATTPPKPEGGEPGAAELSPPLPGALVSTAGEMAAGEPGSPENPAAPGAGVMMAPDGGAPPPAPA